MQTRVYTQYILIYALRAYTCVHSYTCMHTCTYNTCKHYFNIHAYAYNTCHTYKYIYFIYERYVLCHACTYMHILYIRANTNIYIQYEYFTKGIVQIYANTVNMDIENANYVLSEYL